MNWFFIALIAPFIWSILNHVDKYLISKYSSNTGIGGLAIFSSLFAIFVLPIAYLVDPTVFTVSVSRAFFLIITGASMGIAILFYLYALDRDDASVIVPFWFLVPVFAYLLGILLLGEHITGDKIMGGIITLLGALILSLEFDRGISVKKITATLMISSSIFIALSDVIFKGFTVEAPFWHSIFWNQAGMVLFGLSLLCIKKYRHDFRKVLEVRTKEIAMLNISGEIGQAIATVSSYYSTLLAPVALVLLSSYTFQPVFVFLEGIFVTKFFPRIAKEHLNKKQIVQKIASILIMSIGVYLIAM